MIGWLRGHGLHIVVATPDTDRLVSDVDLRGPTAIVVGAEHEGVSAGWFDPAASAPMRPLPGCRWSAGSTA